MKRLIATLLFVAAAAAATASDASAWTRSGAVTGLRGTTSFGGSGSCSGGTYAWQGGGTGPAGNSWSRSGSASCSAGSCTRQGQGTGPRGHSYSYSRTVSR